MNTSTIVSELEAIGTELCACASRLEESEAIRAARILSKRAGNPAYVYPSRVDGGYVVSTLMPLMTGHARVNGDEITHCPFDPYARSGDARTAPGIRYVGD